MCRVVRARVLGRPFLACPLSGRMTRCRGSESRAGRQAGPVGTRSALDAEGTGANLSALPTRHEPCPAGVFRGAAGPGVTSLGLAAGPLLGGIIRPGSKPTSRPECLGRCSPGLKSGSASCSHADINARVGSTRPVDPGAALSGVTACLCHCCPEASVMACPALSVYLLTSAPTRLRLLAARFSCAKHEARCLPTPGSAKRLWPARTFGRADA